MKRSNIKFSDDFQSKLDIVNKDLNKLFELYFEQYANNSMVLFKMCSQTKKRGCLLFNFTYEQLYDSKLESQLLFISLESMLKNPKRLEPSLKKSMETYDIDNEVVVLIVAIHPTNDLFTQANHTVMNKNLGKHAKNRCIVCNKHNSIKICSVCKLARYCGLECQKKDWKEHKKICCVAKK